jgi:hypothetical protein
MDVESGTIVTDLHVEQWLTWMYYWYNGTLQLLTSYPAWTNLLFNIIGSSRARFASKNIAVDLMLAAPHGSLFPGSPRRVSTTAILQYCRYVLVILSEIYIEPCARE